MTYPTLRGTLLAAVLLTGTAAASAASYYVVVPLPNKKVSAENINVALAGFTLPAGLIGTPYAGFNFKSLLSVTGDPDYTGYGVKWQLVSGSLPAGLTFKPDGSISGTPTADGTASFQVQASYKTKTGAQAYQLLIANITVALAAGSPPQAIVGQAYAYDLKQHLSVTGDSAYVPGAVIWSTISNSLPAGLYLTFDGWIGGKPTASGTGTVAARATYKNVKGEQTYQVVSLKIDVALAGAVPEFIVGEPYSYYLQNNLQVTGDPAYTEGQDVQWDITSGTLPPGLALGLTGRITGTPTDGGTSSVTVRATYKHTSAQQTYAMPADKGLHQYADYRSWSDGTFAASCNTYKNPDASHRYAGATGDGVYRIKPGDSPLNVYCDMTTDGGGWTLIVKAQQNSNVHADAGPVGTLSSPAQSTTAKLADATINLIPKTVYRMSNSARAYSLFFNTDDTFSAIRQVNNKVSKSITAPVWEGPFFDPNHRGLNSYQVVSGHFARGESYGLIYTGWGFDDSCRLGIAAGGATAWCSAGDAGTVWLR